MLDLERSSKKLKTAYEPTTVTVSTDEDIYYLLNKAHDNRAVGTTKCNEKSSRSHSIFQLILTGEHPEIKGGMKMQGALNLIDLAGSERLKQSKAEGDTKKETMSINKSLSELGRVITSLNQGQDHIPYRNSKLTKVLEPHLSSESAKVLMIANISPLAGHAAETMNSLRFAANVNSC